jgi:mono/diheme cytochrome c family protein
MEVIEMRGVLAAAGLMAMGAGGAYADPNPDAAAGEGLYQARCAMCHASGMGGAPLMDKLATLEPAVVVDKMTNGTMVAMASGLSDDDKRNIAHFLTKKEAAAAK